MDSCPPKMTEAGEDSNEMITSVLEYYQVHGYVVKHLVQDFSWTCLSLRDLILTLLELEEPDQRKSVLSALEATRDRSFDFRKLLLAHWGQGERFDKRSQVVQIQETTVEVLPRQLLELQQANEPAVLKRALERIKQVSTQGLSRPSSAIVDLAGMSVLVDLLADETHKYCVASSSKLSTPKHTPNDRLLLSTLDTVRSLVCGNIKNSFACSQAGAVTHLVILLEHSCVRVRSIACGILSSMAHDNVGVQYQIRAEHGVPSLMHLLNDSDTELRAKAAEALRRVGALPPKQPLRGLDQWEFLRS